MNTNNVYLKSHRQCLGIRGRERCHSWAVNLFNKSWGHRILRKLWTCRSVTQWGTNQYTNLPSIQKAYSYEQIKGIDFVKLASATLPLSSSMKHCVQHFISALCNMHAKVHRRRPHNKSTGEKKTSNNRC